MKRWNLEAWAEHIAIAIVVLLALRTAAARVAEIGAVAWIR